MENIFKYIKLFFNNIKEDISGIDFAKLSSDKRTYIALGIITVVLVIVFTRMPIAMVLKGFMFAAIFYLTLFWRKGN